MHLALLGIPSTMHPGAKHIPQPTPPTFWRAAKNARARGAVTAATITPLGLVDFDSRVESTGANGFAHHVHPG